MKKGIIGNDYLFEMKTKILLFLVGLVLLLTYVCQLTEFMAGGRGWATPLYLGGVDKWLSGGSFYVIESEGFATGPVYGPGGIVVALIARLLFGYGAENAMIITYSIFALVTFGGFSKLVTTNRKKQIFFFLICLTFFVVGFSGARHRLFVSHPEIPMLMCFVWGLVFLCDYIRTRSVWKYIVATILFMFSACFKVNAVFLYVGLFLGTIFSRRLSRKLKREIIVSEIVSGFGALVIMFLMDGCWDNTVIKMALHSYNIETFVQYVLYAIVRTIPFVLLVCLFFILFIGRKLEFKSESEELCAFCSITLFIFNIYGTLKEGSTSANVESAMIVLMPFALLSIDYIVEGLRSKMVKSAQSVCFVLACVFVIFVCVSKNREPICELCHNVSEIQKKKMGQQRFAQWLTCNYAGKNVTYCGCFYEWMNGANVHKRTDLWTVNHDLMAKRITDEEMEKICKREHWDLIVTEADECYNRMFPKTFSNFRKMEKCEYPNVTSMFVYVLKSEQ